VTIAITRRKLAFGLSSSVLGFGVRTPLCAAESSIAGIEREYGGRLGVFAMDTGSGRTLEYRADERFLMCSTFKGPLAALVLARVDSGKEDLDRRLHYSEKELIYTSPVTKANVAQGALSIGTLCRAMAELSDNTAAVLLLRSVGGPEALTQFVRGLGDAVTRSDRYEPECNQYSGVLDTTSPRAFTQTIRQILLSHVLSARSRGQLEEWMMGCKPGLNRLRAALPADWRAGDRPGTSDEGETNDCAIVRPPGRAPLLISAYYDAPHVEVGRREGVLREVGGVFVRWATGAA
jgi:beta-lactamase class A